MPRIDCFKYIKGNKELEKHFSSIEEDLPESEQRSKSIELANEYYKKLHDEMNDLNILLKKQKVKFKSKNNSEEIKKVKEEADAKIKSLEQSFTQEQGNNANTNKSESNEKANEAQKASNGESGESKVLNEIAQAEGADVQKASDTPRQMEGQKLDVEYKLRYPKNNVLVFVEPSMILDRLAKDDPEFDVQNPKNQIGSRVQKAKDYILNYAKDNRWINPKNGSRSDYSKATFEPSIVAIYNGKIGFEDGRHRILAAKELGISSIGIEVPKAQAEQFKKEFNTQTKNNKNETRKENSKDATKQQTTNGTTSKSDSEVSGQVAPKSDGRGRTKKSKRKVKNPEYLKALSFETVGSPYNYVLQYFIGGGGYSAELLRGLYGKSKGGGNDLSGKKSTIPSEELKSKIGFLEKNGATSSQVLGEKLSESYLDEFRMEQNESNDSQYFRNVIEDVINSFSSRRDMVDYLLKENNAELEYQYQEEYDGIYEQYGDFADQAIDYLSTLSDEQLQELLNDEEAFYQSDSYKELIGENNKGEENVKLSAKENNFVSSSKIDIDEKGNISLNRLSPAEEQGRNRSGEITTLATIVLSRLHSATREKYGNSSAELSTISNEEKKYLENFAKEQGVWVENADKKVGEFYDNGQEQSVYIDPKNPYVVNKLNNGSLEANWLEFLDRLALHNTYFPETAYILKGFGKDSGGNFVAILEQPFIQFTPMSVAEIKQHMIDVMGFELLSKYDDSIIGTIEEDRSFIDKKNGVIIEDLHAKNIYKDDKGNVFVIDPVMSLDTEDRGYGGTRTAELPSFESDAKLSLKVENKKPQNAKEKSTLKKLITTLQKAIKANVFSSQELLKQKLKEYGLDYTKFMQVWHGSPYVFDRFSLDKIGSGEGAQAFGWGLYFTDLKSIAKNYAERLNNINNVYVYNLNVSDNIKGIINESFYINNIYDTNITYEQKEIAKKWLEDSKYSKSEVEKQDIDKAISEIDNLEIKKSTYYKVSLHKGKAPSEYNWLEWDKEVSAETINQILESLSKQGKKLTLNRIDGVGRMVKLSDKDANLRFKNGSEVYNVLKNELGSDRQASLFLLENGIDGIKYPAESVARGATSDNARGFNYVVFDENVITIDERIQFMRTPNGVIYGAKFPDGSIYINNEDIDLSSPIHEFSHLFEEMFPELWSEGVRLFRDSSGFKKALEEVQKNKAYSNLTEQQQASEALNNLIGNKGVGYFAKGVLLSKFQNWVNKLFKTIGNRIGKKYVDKIGQKFGDKIAQKLTLTPDDSLDFFINDVLGKLLGGKELQGGNETSNQQTQFQVVQNETQATKSEIENAISSLDVSVSDYANDDSIDNYLSLNDAFETLAYTSIGDAQSMAKDLSEKYPELKDDFDSIINEASKPKQESKKVTNESDAIRTLISEEVDGRLYPTIVDSLGKFAKQDTAETTSKIQEREVSGEYVRLTLENMKDIAKQKALQLQEVLGEDWVKKSIEFFEREPFSGNPAIIIGLSNIISTDLDAQIKATSDIKELDALVALQNRMDRVVNRNGRVASLALNYRRIFTSFAQGDSVTDAMAGNNLTEESKKQIEVVKKALAEQPTDEQLNSVGNVTTPTDTPTKNTKSSRKTQTDSVLKSQIKNNAINSLTQVDENGKKVTKTWQDAVREANEESKKHKC